MSFFARLLGSARLRRPASDAAPYDAGVAALAERRYALALRCFDAALETAETPTAVARVHNKRALALLRGGDRGAAVAALGAALEADARCVPAIVNVGNLLLEDGVLDDAIAHYEAGLRIDEDYAPAYHNLGIAHRRAGRRAAAVSAFRRAVRLDARARRA